MNKSLRRRVAAVATTATVGGLLLPFLAAGSALAAEPTAITVTNPTQTVPVGTNTATVTGSLTAGSTPANKVYYRITNGPDSTTGTTGKVCSMPTATTFNCGIVPSPTNSVAGTDTIQVFYDLIANGANGTASYQTQDPAATASVIFAGPATKTTVTPTTARTSTGSTASYTVNGTDNVGNPASGTVVVSISQTASTAGGDPLIFSDLTSSVFPASTTNGTTSTTAPASATTTTYTDTQTFSFANGAVNFGVSSSTAGTVTISGGANSTSLTAGSASLAVSAGNTAQGTTEPTRLANDNNAFALTPAPNSTSFTGKTVTSVVTVTNASGDPLGGVRVQGLVTAGPNSGKAAPTATATTVTDQAGHVSLTYTAGTGTGTDTLLAWVNQSTHANTPAADNGEPQGTTAVTISTALTTPAITSNKDFKSAISVTQATTPVTYTLTSGAGAAATPGFNLNFTIDRANSTAGKAFTVTPASAVTNANGQVAVTVSNPAPAAGDKILVIATLAGDASTTDTAVELDYVAAAATSSSVTPANQSLAAGSKVTVTANVFDQSKNPVSGAAVTFAVAAGGRNGPAVNANASGVVTTDANGHAAFTYTDVGTPVSTGTSPTDTVTATVSGIGSVPTATVTFVPGTATTSTVGLTVGAGAAITTSTVTTTNPTAVNPTANVIVVKAQPKDISTNILYNKTVTFTSTGVGTFTDSSGNPIGNSTTAQVDGTSGFASVNVRSTAPGTETIFASADTTSSNTVTVTYTSGFASITPERVLDTRTGQGSLTIAGGGNAPQRLAPNTNYTFNIAATDLPQGQAAYAFNVTAIGADRVGNLRIASTCTTANSPTPTTSLIGYQPGADVANFVVVANNNTSGANPVPCNTFTIYSDGSGVSVAIDAVGYYSAAGITAITPSRIVDTRTGQGGSNGPLAAGSRHFFQVAPAVAPGATQPVKAVALNVTAINPSGLGYLQVYPDGATQPTASNINYIPGVDKAAFVIVNVPANGQIDVYSAGSSAGVAIDLFATFPASTSTLVTSAPVRVLDTRLTANTINANGTLNVQVTGAASVPADAQAVLVSLTAIHTTGGTGVGNLRAYPAGGVLPTVSTVNYVSSTSDVANFAIVKLGTNGQLSLYSDGSPIDVAVDVVGYVPAG